MIFATTTCPICLSNLVKDEKQDIVSFICPKIRVTTRNWLDTGVVDYPHYAHRVPIASDGSLLEHESEVSMLLPPYMLGHYAKHKKTDIYALSTEKPHELIVSVPLLEKNYTHIEQIMSTLHTLVIFS